MEFEWDAVKAADNERKHGVSFMEAASCFWDPLQVAFYDPDHSDDEDREILIGHSHRDRLLMVVYTLRGETIRVVSARRAKRKEAKDYERGL
ncbi:MAG: BrnT family toxin [bacterium]|nr:BrnT family toxin [bacterium]